MPRLNDADTAERAARRLPNGVEPGDFSEALARGLRIMEAFDRDHRRMTVADAARAVDLPRATVRRTLSTLVHLGYMRLDGRVYELTPTVLRIAAAYLEANPGSTILQPACERLCTQVGETCSVAVLDGADAVIIARAAPNQLINIGVGVGHRLPALHSSLGRMLVASLDDARLDAILATTRPRAFTEYTVTDKRKLRSAIHTARRDGFAYADREVLGGFRAVAVAVHRWDGQPIAAMNIGASSDRVDEETMLGPLLDALRAATTELRGILV